MDNIAIKLILALLIGAAVGFERESDARGHEDLLGGGVRTFSLVSLIGFLAGLFYLNSLPVITIVVSFAFFAFVIVYYFLHVKETKSFGLTTEMAYVVTYSLGVLLALNIIDLRITIALAVVLVAILSFKDESKKILSIVSRPQFESFVAYAIIALVIFPFLPNSSFTIGDFPTVIKAFSSFGIDTTKLGSVELINPSKLWFYVVLITGIEVLSFIAMKLIGKGKGMAVASFASGFVSSTSATQSLAVRSKAVKSFRKLVGYALLANVASFLQIFLLVVPLSLVFFKTILPSVVVMIVVGLILAFYNISKDKESDKAEDNEEESNLFSLIPAIKFAVLILVVKFVTSISLVYFGQAGFLFSSIIASFAGIDAVLINLATISGQSISLQFGLVAFLAVNATNLAAKSFYAHLQGSPKFAKGFALSVFLIVLASLSGFFFI